MTAGAEKDAFEINRNPPAWWRQGVDDLSWEETTSGGVVLWYTKSGACPRCGHADGIRVSLEAVAWLGLDGGDDTDVYVTCTCSSDAHNRPGGTLEGCGWGAYVTGPAPVGGR